MAGHGVIQAPKQFRVAHASASAAYGLSFAEWMADQWQNKEKSEAACADLLLLSGDWR
jgi:hypothetical protein